MGSSAEFHDAHGKVTRVHAGPSLSEAWAEQHEAATDVAWKRNANSPEARHAELDMGLAHEWLKNNPDAPLEHRAAARRQYFDAYQARANKVTGFGFPLACPSCKSVWNPDYRDPQTGRKPARSSGNGIKHYRGCPDAGGPLDHER